MAKSKQVEAAGILYDPRKSYKWQPTDKFVLSGNEFGALLNTLRSILQSPQAQPFLAALEASKVVEGLMAKSVEAGVAKEADPSEVKQQ